MSVAERALRDTEARVTAKALAAERYADREAQKSRADIAGSTNAFCAGEDIALLRPPPPASTAMLRHVKVEQLRMAAAMEQQEQRRQAYQRSLRKKLADKQALELAAKAKARRERAQRDQEREKEAETMRWQEKQLDSLALSVPYGNISPQSSPVGQRSGTRRLNDAIELICSSEAGGGGGDDDDDDDESAFAITEILNRKRPLLRTSSPRPPGYISPAAQRSLSAPSNRPPSSYSSFPSSSAWGGSKPWEQAAGSSFCGRGDEARASSPPSMRAGSSHRSTSTPAVRPPLRHPSARGGPGGGHLRISPRARAAQSYVARINRLLACNRSAASLLFDSSAVDLWVGIDAGYDHFTITSLMLPGYIEVRARRIGNFNGPVAVMMSGPAEIDERPYGSTMLLQGDELLLRAQPHILAQVAHVAAGGRVVLLSGHARESTAFQVKRERQLLFGASAALKRRLLPNLRRMAQTSKAEAARRAYGKRGAR